MFLAVVHGVQLVVVVLTDGYQLCYAVHIMFVLERINLIQSLLHGLKADGVAFHAVLAALHLVGDVLQLDIARVYSVGQGRRTGIFVADGLKGRNGALEQSQHVLTAGLVFSGYHRLGYIQLMTDLFRMLQQLALLLQLLLFRLRLQAGVGKLLILETPVVLVIAVALRRCYRFLQKALCLTILPVGLAIAALQLAVAGEKVEHLNLKTFLVEQ